MRRKVLEIANKNTVVEVGVVRVKKADETEKICFYFGDKLVLETSLSRFDKDKEKMADYGVYLSIHFFLDLERKLQSEYDIIPVYCEPNGYGYQFNGENKIMGYACSNWMIDKANQAFIALAQNENMGIDFLNSYIMKQIERQVILLHQLSAPIGALDKHNHILVLAGATSTGKTTIGNLTKSFFGGVNSHFLGGNMNATISALENEIASLCGVPYYMDDASLVGESFDWVNFLYRLANGETKKRANYKEPNLTVATRKYYSHFLISSENSILDKVMGKTTELNSNLEGTLARVTEIWIEKNSSLLFDNELQLEKVVDFYENNYGNLASLLVKKIFEKGVDAVKQEIRKLSQEIIESNKIEDNLLKRKAKTIAIIVYTADMANSFGLQFDKDSIIKFMMEQTEKTIKSFAFSNEKVYEIAIKKLIKTARDKGEKAKDGSYYLLSKNYEQLIDELKNGYEKHHFSAKKFKAYAMEKGVMIPIRDKASGTFSCNDIRGRGYHIKEVE